jgi:hypothetical protein
LQADASDLKTWVKNVLFTGSDISFPVVNKFDLLGFLETWRKNNLKDALLSSIDWSGVRLKFPAGKVPSVVSFYDAENLQELDPWKSTHSLAELRDTLKKYSLRDQERDITYALKKAEREKKYSDGNHLESFFLYILFEFTSGWGRSSKKPLIILIYLWVIISLLFAISVFNRGQKELRFRRKGHTYEEIHSFLIDDFPNNSPGVWATFPNYLSEKSDNGFILKCVTPSFFFRNVHQRWRKKSEVTKLETMFRLLSALCFGLFYGLYTAFQIGWSEFSMGNIIARIQTREYTLQATAGYELLLASTLS